MSRNLWILLLMLAATVYGGFKVYAYFAASQRINQLTAPLTHLGEFHHEGLSVSLRGPVSIKNARFVLHDGGEVTVEKLVLEQSKQLDNWPLPGKLLLRAEGAYFDPAMLRWLSEAAFPKPVLTPVFTSFLRDLVNFPQLGYAGLRADIEFEAKKPLDANDLSLRLRQRADGMGEIEARIELTDVHPSQVEDGFDASLSSAFLEFTDQGYAQRLVNLYAARNNQPGEGYQHKLVAQISHNLSTTGLLLDTQNVDNLRHFLLTPGNLRITVAPEEQVLVSSLQFYKTRDLPELLKLRVRAQ